MKKPMSLVDGIFVRCGRWLALSLGSTVKGEEQQILDLYTGAVFQRNCRSVLFSTFAHSKLTRIAQLKAADPQHIHDGKPKVKFIVRGISTDCPVVAIMIKYADSDCRSSDVFLPGPTLAGRRC